MCFRVGDRVERRNVNPIQRGTVASMRILSCRDGDSYIPMPAYAVDCDDGKLRVWLENETLALSQLED